VPDEIGEGTDMGLFAAFVLSEVAVSQKDDLVAALLICMVTAVVVSAVTMRYVLRVVVTKEKRRQSAFNGVPEMNGSILTLFDAPTRWLAVRTQNPLLVQHVLGLQNARMCTWNDFLGNSSEPRLFISPPVRGWVLVMGCDLPDPSEDIDQCFLFLSRLSQQLGEVQFFSRNRAVSHHGWAKLSGGKVVRAYMWAGETLWDQGAVTEAERELKLRCLTYTESSEALGFGEREVLMLNTEKVVRLASDWSLDPTAIDAAILENKGIAGDLLHSKLH
jgi:hypothetical protein